MRLSRNVVIAFFVKTVAIRGYFTMKQHYATLLYRFFRKRINLIENGTKTPHILHEIEAVRPSYAIPWN